MIRTTHSTSFSNALELDFVERVRTPKPLMREAIELHLAGLSLSSIKNFLENRGLERTRKAIHDWTNKTDLEPRENIKPDKIALDETVVKVNGERYWLYGAVDVETGKALHVELYPARNTIYTKIFLLELKEKYEIDNCLFLVDGAPWLHAALYDLELEFEHVTFGDRNPVERYFQEIKRKTSRFYNSFSNTDPETADNWIKTQAWYENQLK